MHVSFIMVVVMPYRDRRIRLSEFICGNWYTLHLGRCWMRRGERRVLYGNFLMKRFDIKRGGLDWDSYLCVKNLS